MVGGFLGFPFSNGDSLPCAFLKPVASSALEMTHGLPHSLDTRIICKQNVPYELKVFTPGTRVPKFRGKFLTFAPPNEATGMYVHKNKLLGDG